MGVRSLEEGKEWRLQGILYVGVLNLFSKLEEGLKVLVDHFVKVC